MHKCMIFIAINETIDISIILKRHVLVINSS